MGGSVGSAGATGGGAIAGGVGPPVPGVAAGGGMQDIMRRMAPMFLNGGQTPEGDQMLTNLARSGPPPVVQPIAFEGGMTSGYGKGGIGGALRPPQPRLPPPRRFPMMRGEAATNPMSIGGALAGRY